MKKYLPFAVTAMAILGLGSLTSCHDEDFDVSNAVLQERAFEQGFIKEFGKPSADQSWDFYTQKMESIRREAGETRATMDEVPVGVDKTISQPSTAEFKKLVQNVAYSLEEGIDNSRTGQNYYTLTSTGTFKIYAVRYAGAIEVESKYSLDFGVSITTDDKGTIDITDDVVEPHNLFGSGFKNGFTPGEDHYGNPGWAAEVTIPKGQKFNFYLKYTSIFGYWSYGRWYDLRTRPQAFYTNGTPRFQRYDGSWCVYNNADDADIGYYEGPSTLLYSTEYYDEETQTDKQIMIIGFEDCWGQGESQYTQFECDKDFNDVVFIIEGNLPLPSSKRFFCEDKTSFDWDYNDVVFDVSNTGIVLRAVGGTQPVFLRVTDRLGQTTTYGELHELMRSIQPQVGHRTKELTYQKDGKTYYKPIDVAAYSVNKEYPGVWFDAVQIATWTRLGTDGDNFTRLDDDNNEVEKFGTDPSFPGKAELIVLPEHQPSYNLDEISKYEALSTLSSDEKDKIPYKIITATPPGNIPSMWIAPVSVIWMKELQKITLGYRYFYGGSGETDDEGNLIPWYANGLYPDYLYPYDHDEE
jgi:hypothetical protein